MGKHHRVGENRLENLQARVNRESSLKTSKFKQANRWLAGIVVAASFGVTDTQAQQCPGNSHAPQTFNIVVNDGEPSFEGNTCPGQPGKKPGDACNKKGDRPQMRFKLKGNVRGWSLVRMELSHDGVTFPDSNLPAGAYADFSFANEGDWRNGWPEGELRANGKQLWVNNDNCETFDVHYRVLLKGPDGERYVHPVIQNRGVGN